MDYVGYIKVKVTPERQIHVEVLRGQSYEGVAHVADMTLTPAAARHLAAALFAAVDDAKRSPYISSYQGKI